MALVAVSGLIELALRRLLSRPFYYDEAWRAYEISLGHRFLGSFHIANAPLALGWFGIESAARIVLGNTEAGLRAPMFLAFPVLGAATYRVARCWLGVLPSFLVAGMLLVNGWIAFYALQLKSYSYEALVAVATLGLYLVIRRSTWGRLQLIGLFALLGLACVFSLPNVFVAGPLLVLELSRAVRERHQRLLRIAGVALTAVIALAHYLLFVSPQSNGTGKQALTSFFRQQFAPHQLGGFIDFVGRGLASYLPSGFLGAAGQITGGLGFPLPALASDLISAVVVVLLISGVTVAARNAAGRALITAAGGALLCELLGSVARKWPFGLLRVNIFILPLLYILAGIGAVALLSLARDPVRAFLGRSRLTLTQTAALIGTVAVVTATAAATFLATAGALTGTAEGAALPDWWGDTKTAVAHARLTGGPGDLVIIRSDRKPADWYFEPWQYYMQTYQGFPARITSHPPIPASSTLAVFALTPGTIGRFVASHPHARTLYLLEYRVLGDTAPHVGAEIPASVHTQSMQALARYGFCTAVEIPLIETGELTVVSRGGCTSTTGTS